MRLIEKFVACSIPSVAVSFPRCASRVHPKHTKELGRDLSSYLYHACYNEKGSERIWGTVL